MNDKKTKQSVSKAKIWAVGGGKGGVGKSIMSILLALELAGRNQETVLVDADLGGANLHTLMGIKNPVRTLHDFVSRKYDSIEEICIRTETNRLKLVCGASDILSIANPQFAQKNKIVQSILDLAVDHVILDLGAGTSYNVLDFFLIADHAVVVVTPQPISIQNAYAFIRNAVYRKLYRLTARQPAMQNMIRAAMDPKNDEKMRTIHDLFDAIAKTYNQRTAVKLQGAVNGIRPLMITNMARTPRDHNAGKIIQLVAEKYLTVQSEDLGAIDYDPVIEAMVSQMVSLAELSRKTAVRSSVTGMIDQLQPKSF